MSVSSTHHSSFCFSKEIECARAILRREGAGVASSLGELIPVSVCPEQEHSLPVLTEPEGRCRRVFLTCGPTEDLFWAMHSIRFIIDAGVQKRYVCSNFTMKLLLTFVIMIVHWFGWYVIHFWCAKIQTFIFHRCTTLESEPALLLFNQSAKAKLNAANNWLVQQVSE